VKSNLLIIAILVKTRPVKMAFIPFVNAAAIRKNEVGQKWIIVLKEKYAHSVNKKRILMIFIKDEIR
jgi:hypothetical protein